MLNSQLLLGSLMIAATVTFHAASLVLLASVLRRLDRTLRGRMREAATYLIMLVVAVMAIIGVHTAEVWSWAGLFLALGEFDALRPALYFSAVTATTLGYGDIVLSDSWQILGTFEAMGGLILFGASTAFLLELMREIFRRDGAR